MQYKMKKYFWFYCMATCFITSCSVLSHSQLRNIHAFAVPAKNYPNFALIALRRTNRLQYNNNIMEASIMPDSQLVFQSLKQSKGQFERSLEFSKKMDLDLQLIEKYATLLEQLTSGYYTDFDESDNELVEDLEGAINLFNSYSKDSIPDNVLDETIRVKSIINTKHKKAREAKALKKIIQVADTLIQISASNLINILDSDLRPVMEYYNLTFMMESKTILFRDPSLLNYTYLKFYVKQNEDFVDLQLLVSSCINALQKMSFAHKELKNNIIRRKALFKTLDDTKIFARYVKSLYQISEKLASNEW